MPRSGSSSMVRDRAREKDEQTIDSFFIEPAAREDVNATKSGLVEQSPRLHRQRGEDRRVRLFELVDVEGSLDLVGVLRVLAARDYDGWLMVEQDSSWSPPS